MNKIKTVHVSTHIYNETDITLFLLPHVSQSSSQHLWPHKGQTWQLQNPDVRPWIGRPGSSPTWEAVSLTDL